MNTTKTAATPKTNGTEKPEGIRVPLAQRVKPFNLAATETCRWFDGPWKARSGLPGTVLDACTFTVGDIDTRSCGKGQPLEPKDAKHMALVLAAPLLLAAVEQYRLHCDAPLALTMAVDKLLETIE
jgi:hypothetical protein